MIRIDLPLALLATVCISGCGGRDIKQVADQSVETDILAGAQKVDAVDFFEKGGTYYDDEDATGVDREILLPMLKRLLEVFPSEQWVVPREEEPTRAYAVLITLPDDKNVEDAMAKVVEAADDKFDGLILQQWGHRWLSIDFLDAETVEFLKKSDPDLEKQR